MSTILEKANEILTEKKSKILPANIKAGIQIFDIIGTLEELNTSDATATADDIVFEKTAYVNGEKIEGNVWEVPADGICEENWNGNVEIDESRTDEVLVYFKGINSSDVILRTNAEISILVNRDDFADKIGLTPEVILEGNTILGIVGTGKSGEDLQAQLDAQDTLIAEQQAKIEELTALLESKTEEV